MNVFMELSVKKNILIRFCLCQVPQAERQRLGKEICGEHGRSAQGAATDAGHFVEEKGGPSLRMFPQNPLDMD